MADKKITKAEVRALVKADRKDYESPAAHDKGVAERLKQAIKDEAEKN